MSYEVNANKDTYQNSNDRNTSLSLCLCIVASYERGNSPQKNIFKNTDNTGKYCNNIVSNVCQI